MSSSDVRRSTIVKIPGPERTPSQRESKSLTPSPKANMSTKEELATNRWTSSVTLSPHFEDNSSIYRLTPNPTPTSTLKKPKPNDCDQREEKSMDGTKFNSPDLVSSENHLKLFEDNFKRSETFCKKLKEIKEKQTDVIRDSHNSRCIFVSQIHLIFHISITICLLGYEGICIFQQFCCLFD